MEKKTKIIYLEKEDNITLDLDPLFKKEFVLPEIDRLIHFLQESKEKGATHIEFNAVIDFEGEELEDLTFFPVYYRQETDEELQKRIEEAAQKKKLAEERERKEYEKLKAKFEA